MKTLVAERLLRHLAGGGRRGRVNPLRGDGVLYGLPFVGGVMPPPS